MYNWSTDEEKYKDRYPLFVRKTVSFLETHSDIKSIEISQIRQKANHLIFRPKYKISVKVDPLTKPAIKTTLAKTLQEMFGKLRISVIEKK